MIISYKTKMMGIIVSLAILTPSNAYADNMSFIGNWGGGWR